MLGKALTTAAAGNAGAAGGLGIEDVFSTWLYTGTGTTQTITNGVDLAGEGGLVWIKNRTNAVAHRLFDTARGPDLSLDTTTTGGNVLGWFPGYFSGFTSTGFGFGSSVSTALNTSGDSYASWTFRKAPGFFDVVTWVGDGVNGRAIAHSLGSTPGFVIIKRTDTTSDWTCWHNSFVTSEYILLNSTAAKAGGTVMFLYNPGNSAIYLRGTSNVNASGGTYVAYLFAHDAGGFGDSGNESVVKCGSYTGTGSNGNFVDLGWEPQYLLVKGANVTSGWTVVDNMRGLTVGDDAILNANNSSSEAGLGSPYNAFDPAPTGFIVNGNFGNTNASGFEYIYIAIRRGPMKTPESGTEVFSAITYTGDGSNDRKITGFGFPPDAVNIKARSSSPTPRIVDRVRGPGVALYTPTTDAEGSTSGVIDTFLMDGIQIDSNIGVNNGSITYVMHNFRRAPGFFDVVAYTGTGSGDQTISHNLTVTPEFIIVKRRNATGTWYCYHPSITAIEYLELNSINSRSGSTVNFTWNPTSATFNADSYIGLNSANSYIAYLFASCPGVSKVGSYTGTGTTLNVDCGFTSGARFVLIKRTDSTGDWYVWDTARGIVSGNDPYLLLNSTAAEVTSTDYIDPLSSGFQISSTAPAAINASGGSYIFLAIA